MTKMFKNTYKYIIERRKGRLIYMDKYKEILKNTPDYEEYTANEAKLSIDEMRELGLLKCGGCCSSKNGCSKKTKCCKAKK